MSAAAAHTDQIASYLERVRAALSELPDETRDELLDDLADHLAEVLAEDAGTLEERLGPPESYAEELRAAAGVGTAAAPVPTSRSTLRRVRSGLVRLDSATGRLLGYGQASQLWQLLRPGWWVLRGYLVGVLIIGGLFNGGVAAWVPRLDASALGWLLVVGVCVVASIRLGQVTPRLGAWPRAGLVAGALIVLALATAALDAGVPWVGAGPPAAAEVIDPHANVTDVYPYGPDGRPLSGVTLYDQNGQRIMLGNPWQCVKPRLVRSREAGPKAPDGVDVWVYEQPPFVYPLCPTEGWAPAPPATPAPAPPATPAPAPPATPAPSPSPTG